MVTEEQRGTSVRLPIQQYRAMVFPRDGYWYAECIDLSLAVRRRTRQDAIEALDAQVVLHLSTVLGENLPSSLLRRPSPLSHLLRYYRYAFEDQIIGPLLRPSYDRPRLTFNTPVHA